MVKVGYIRATRKHSNDVDTLPVWQFYSGLLGRGLLVEEEKSKIIEDISLEHFNVQTRI